VRTSSRSPLTSKSALYAAGKFGRLLKREGRPTERAILTARMIDRPIRPLWPKGYKNETQVICTVLSAGPDHLRTTSLCINGASAALMLSPMPFLGPVGASTGSRSSTVSSSSIPRFPRWRSTRSST